MPIQYLARFRRCDPSFGSQQQLLVHLGFQGDQLLADRWLGNVQQVGGLEVLAPGLVLEDAAEASGLGRGQRLGCQHANSIWSPPLRRHRRLAATVLLVSLLTGCGSWHPVSEQGRERCVRESRRGAETNALSSALAYGQCLFGVDTRLAREQERSLRQQREIGRAHV